MDEKRGKKKLFMTLGIIVVMIFIFALWAINMKNVWQLNQARFAVENQTNWAQLKTDFDTTVGDLNSRLKTVAAQNKLATDLASSTVLSEIMNRAKALAATSSMAVSTSTAGEILGLPNADSITTTTASTTATSSATTIATTSKIKKAK